MVKTFFAVASMLALSLLIASPNSADHCDGCDYWDSEIETNMLMPCEVDCPFECLYDVYIYRQIVRHSPNSEYASGPPSYYFAYKKQCLKWGNYACNYIEDCPEVDPEYWIFFTNCALCPPH